MKTLLHRLFKLAAVFCLCWGFSTPVLAQGKKIFVGTGSGFVDYSNAQATLNLKDEDTVVIRPGKYKLMNFQNITASPGHKIYIMNGGAVEFSDPSASTFYNLTNVEIRGDGDPTVPYGFYIHDVLRGISIGGNMSGVTFSHVRMDNVTDYGIFMSNQSHVYDGTNNPNSLFYDVHFLHFYASHLKTTFLQLGAFTRIMDDGMINMTRKLEFGYSIIEYSDQLDVLRLNKVMDADVHHNQFRHLGQLDFRHSAMIYLYGNGNIHHNHMYDYWGSGVRAHAFSVDAPGAINIYNNIMVNARKYSGVEAFCTPQDIQSNPVLRYCNFKIYNNTFGNLSAADFAAAMVDTYNAAGGTIEIKNNLGFNIERDKAYDPLRNYIYQQYDVTKPDTAANIYRRNVSDLYLVNDSTCMPTLSTPGIDKGLSLTMVNDDFDAVPRPQSGAWDIGAREYKTGIVYPVAKAGNDVNIVLPQDSALLNGSASFNPGGGNLTYKWSLVSGPSTISFVNDTLSTAVADSLKKGTYLVQLTVTNAAGQSNSDTLLIVVSNAPLVPPTAKAGNDFTMILPQNTATLNGSASVSNGGGALRYAWTRVSGPAGYTITGDTTAVASLSGLAAGTFFFRLLVTDTNGLSSADTVIFTVYPAPVPTANAGNDITLTLPANSTNLDGTASTTPGGGALQYAWTKISGPATFTITGENTATPTLSGLIQGVYQFRLTVTNAAGTTSSDLIDITVLPAPVAIANAGADITITLPTNSVSLNGAGSYSTGAGALTYVWSFVSGPAGSSISGANTASATITGLAEGVYVFSLQVTNQQGSSATDQVQVTVNKAAPVYPVADAGADITIVLPATTANLDGTRSSDPAGGSLSYSWSLVSGPAGSSIAGGNSAAASISGLTEGVYVFSLQVTNQQGLSATDQVQVTVNKAVPVYPIAVAGSDILLELPVNSTSLDGTRSSDPAGGSLSYSWSKISGPSAFSISGAGTATPVVSALTIGNYQLRLTVTNASGLSASDTVSVTVTVAMLPVAVTGADTTINYPNSGLTLNGSASYATGGATLSSYRWTQVSGPSTVSLTSSSSATTSATGLAPGDYSFKLTVTDNRDQSAEKTMRVTVVDKTTSMQRISLYPNPCANILHIKAVTEKTGTVLVRITSMAGIIMQQQSFEKNSPSFEEQINVSNLSAGAYILEVLSGQQSVLLGKFIKR